MEHAMERKPSAFSPVENFSLISLMTLLKLKGQIHCSLHSRQKAAAAKLNTSEGTKKGGAERNKDVKMHSFGGL